MQQLIKQAVDAALNQNWQQAIELNKQILSGNPNHIPTLNRLAKAYVETNEIDAAKNLYGKVLDIDKYNNIAQKNLEKINNGFHQTESSSKKQYIYNFIDEPGKTKTFSLSRLANTDVLSGLEAGETLSLEPKNRWIQVNTIDGKKIGVINDEDSVRLKHFMEAGNDYEAAIKALAPKKVVIFVRETQRSKKLQDIPTF